MSYYASGFHASPYYSTPYYGPQDDTPPVVDPVPKFKGGGGGLGPIRKGKSGPVANIRQHEEQKILALIAAFVEILE